MVFEAALICVAGAATAWMGRKRVASRRQWMALWQDMATSRHGVFSPANSFTGFYLAETGGDKLFLEVADSSLCVETVVRDKTLSTRVRVCYLLGGGPRFSVHRASLLSPLGQDMVLGRDKRFDDRYVVRGDHPQWVREIWSDQLVALVLDRFPHCVVESDGVEVQVDVPGVTADRAELETLLEFARLLAAPRSVALNTLRGIGRVADYVAPEGVWDARTEPKLVFDLPTPVTARCRWTGSGYWVKAVVRGIPRSLALRIQVDDNHGVHGDVDALPQGLASMLPELGRAKLAAKDGAATLRMPRQGLHGKRLLAGARLLSGLARAGPGAGPLR